MSKPGAKRMADVSASGTVKIANAVARLKAESRTILSFSVGEPDFETPVHVREAAKRALDAGHTHYTPSSGIPELREAIARKSREENRIPCESKHVMVTPAKQGVFQAMLATLDAGDEVVLPDPGWVSYEPIARLCGARPVGIELRVEEDYRMLPERVAQAITPRTRMIVVNSPSNPTGGVATTEDLKGVADLAKDHDLLVLTDELYEKLVYEGTHLSLASHPDTFERTITVNGFSKAYAMTGWRLGWLVMPEPIFAEVDKLQQHSITHATSFAQYGGLAALSGPQDFIGEMRAEFQARRDLVVDRLSKIEGFTVNRPKGAFYVFPRYNFDMTSEALSLHLLEQGGVAVTPGAAFGGYGERHVRISYAASRETIARGLDALERAVATM